MKKIISTLALAIALSSSAFASDQSKPSIGIGYGLDNGGVISLHGDFSIADKVNNEPVKVRLGWDHYSQGYGFGNTNYSWSYNVFYGGAYYDFNRALKLDSKIHPFAGLGIGFGNAICSGPWCNNVGSPTVGGLYYLIGAQYDLTPNVNAELNINGWGGLTIGANLKF